MTSSYKINLFFWIIISNLFKELKKGTDFRNLKVFLRHKDETQIEFGSIKVEKGARF